jgi:hypothetical protein
MFFVVLDILIVGNVGISLPCQKRWRDDIECAHN